MITQSVFVFFLWQYFSRMPYLFNNLYDNERMVHKCFKWELYEWSENVNVSWRKRYALIECAYKLLTSSIISLNILIGKTHSFFLLPRQLWVGTCYLRTFLVLSLFPLLVTFTLNHECVIWQFWLLVKMLYLYMYIYESHEFETNYQVSSLFNKKKSIHFYIKKFGWVCCWFRAIFNDIEYHFLSFHLPLAKYFKTED